MSQIAEHSAVSVGSIPRKVWTREEAHALLDLGFPNAEQLELVAGELISKVKKRPHVLWKNKVQRWLNRTFGEVFVQSESPIEVLVADRTYNEPEPDLVVTQKADSEYNSSPSAEEVRLLVEISDSTLDYDLRVKAALYARAGIQDYWVVDVTNRRIYVLRDPQNGRYLSVETVLEETELAPLAAPDHKISLNRL